MGAPCPIAIVSVSKDGLLGTPVFGFSGDVSTRLLSKTHHPPICQPDAMHSLPQPKPISNSSATRQPSRLSAKAQRPPSGLPSVFPEAKLVSIKPSALDQLPVPSCQQEELPPPALKSSVSLSSNYLVTRVLMAQNTLLEEQRATQYTASLSDPILATRLRDLPLWFCTNTPPSALEATGASADTMNPSPATLPLCLLSQVGPTYPPLQRSLLVAMCRLPASASSAPPTT